LIETCFANDYFLFLRCWRRPLSCLQLLTLLQRLRLFVARSGAKLRKVIPKLPLPSPRQRLPPSRAKKRWERRPERRHLRKNPRVPKRERSGRKKPMLPSRIPSLHPQLPARSLPRKLPRKLRPGPPPLPPRELPPKSLPSSTPFDQPRFLRWPTRGFCRQRAALCPRFPPPFVLPLVQMILTLQILWKAMKLSRSKSGGAVRCGAVSCRVVSCRLIPFCCFGAVSSYTHNRERKRFR